MPTEIERKFTIAPEQDVPDLSDVVEPGDTRDFSLDATYVDTPALDLARNRITLRRRTGGEDAGWHLKLPGDGHAREEIHAPIVQGAPQLHVPVALREQVVDGIDRAPLVPVARLVTQRRETDLVVDGTRVATLCDDRVTATRNGRERTWRELEVELADGDADDLERITRALADAGIAPSPAVSKLVQALGEKLPDARSTRVDDASSGAEVLAAYIGEQVGAIQSREAGVRVDAPDAVHKMRVAARRLRSTLRTFRDLLDAERTEPLRGELRWLGEILGAPRDAEVLKERLTGSIKALPEDALVGDVVGFVTSELDEEHRVAHAALVAAMDTPRYAALLDDLVRLVADPPMTAGTDRRARKVLGRPLEKADARVSRRWEAAGQAQGAERLELAHEARKKAKAARYAWEAAGPALPSASKAATAWEEVTETLGTAQDTVVAQERIHDLVGRAEEAGVPSFTLGVLWAREQEQRESAHAEADRAIGAAMKASRT